MAKSQKSGAAPVKKQTTEPSTPAPAAPTTNPANDPTVVPPVADPATPAAPSTEENATPPVENGAAAQAPVNDEPAPVEVKESMKRAELDAVALEAGLTNVTTYKDKAAVVAAIERVRGGEDANVVDEELKPVVNSGEANVEIEVTTPFFDADQNVPRRAGAKYMVTEERAAKLRGLNLAK